MRLVLTFAILLITSSLSAEKLPPILRRLAQAQGNILTYTHEKKPFFPIRDLSSNFNEHYQHILKTSNGLFLTQSGTNRLYQLHLSQDTVRLERKDITYFSGSNYFALFFAIDTTFYSYGGEGFWRFNGDLRLYDPEIREWAIRLTDKYVGRRFVNHLKENFHFIDTKNRVLYMAGPKMVDDPIKTRFTENSPWYGKMLRLSIDSANWEVLGTIQDRWLTYSAITPFGILADQYLLLDVAGNKVLEIKGKTRRKLENTPTSSEYQQVLLTFCIDSTIFYGDMENWIDSVKIDPLDIVDTGLKVYEPEKRWSDYLLAGGGLVLLAVAGIGIRNRKSKATVATVDPISPVTEAPAVIEKTEPRTLSSSLTNELLEEREKELLGFILKQSKGGRLTTVAELNELLGLSKRTLEVQKRIRVDTLSAIIKKCQYLTKNEEPILSRLRSELDGRMFEYFIEEKRYAETEQILG